MYVYTNETKLIERKEIYLCRPFFFYSMDFNFAMVVRNF